MCTIFYGFGIIKLWGSDSIMDPRWESNLRRYDDFNIFYDSSIKTRFTFSDFSLNQKEFKRKYNNNWNELREYVGLNNIELINNELVIINLNYKQEPKKYNGRIISGTGGAAFSN